MYQSTIFCLILYILAISSTLIPCSKYKIKNGRLRMKSNAKLVRFICNKGYMLLGPKYGGCINGFFDVYPPICVNNKPNCNKIKGLTNGLAFPEPNNIVVHFFCKPGFRLMGSNMTICDGNQWIYQLPHCLAGNAMLPAKNCSFESDDICGWNPDLNHNYDWIRLDPDSAPPDNGPIWDHTFGTTGLGHYMYVESRPKNDSSRLISPIFPKSDQICVSFYYSMSGVELGKLYIYVKQIDENFDTLLPIMTVTSDRQYKWEYGQFSLENGTSKSFQVIFEGFTDKSFYSDIAIDDVTIDDTLCPEEVTEITTDTSSFTDTSETPFFHSCFDRCGQNLTDFPCSCPDNCYELNICCADYIQYCFLNNLETSSDFTSEPSISETTSKLETSIQTFPPKLVTSIKTTTQTIPPKPVTSVKTSTQTFPPKPVTSVKTSTQTFPPPKPVTSIKTSTQTFPPKPVTSVKTSTQTFPPKPTTSIKTSTQTFPPKPTTSVKTSTQPVKLITTSTPTTVFVEDDTSPSFPSSPEIMTDFLPETVQHLQQDTKIPPKLPSNNLTAYFGVGGSVFVVFIVVGVVLMVKRNELLCQKFKSSRQHDSMSDVRFLASDEVLDFTFKRSDSL